MTKPLKRAVFNRQQDCSFAFPARYFNVVNALSIFFLLFSISIANASCALSPEPHPKSVVGLHLFYPDDQRSWQWSDELGITWTRLEIRWDWIEPYQGNFDSSYADSVFALASAHPKMRLMVLFNHPPLWTVKTPDRLPTNAATAMTWLMKRYGNRISAVEVFNEPNLPQYGWPNAWSTLKDSATAYANTLTAVSSAIRNIDKNVFVISAGLSPQNNPEDFARYIVRFTPPECFDGLGLHPYGQKWRFQAIRKNAATLFAQEQRQPKPVWFTEYGSDTDSERPALLAALAIERIDTPIVFFFTERDFGSLVTESYGLRYKDGRAKQDFIEFKKIASQLPPTAPIPAEAVNTSRH